MKGILKKLRNWRFLYHISRIHYDDPVRDIRDHAHIMGDEHYCHIALLPKSF